MKPAALALLVGLSLTTGSVSTSNAGETEVLRIPQGGGQFIEVRTGRPAKPIVGLFGPGRVKAKAKLDPTVAAKEKDKDKAKLHVVTSTNLIGAQIVLYAR